jgi:serine/threonine-protein kinase
MTVAKDLKPWTGIQDDPGACGSEIAFDSASGRSRTRVLEPPSTGVRFARRWNIDSNSSSRQRPLQSPRMKPPLDCGYQLGPYRLLERLGRGAQGDVWKALRRDPFAELVAIKVLKPSLAHNPARIAQFRREAERGIRLAGPSLLTVNELDSVDGYLFMVMPYVEGITLREVVRCRLDYFLGAEGRPAHHLATLDEPEYLRAMARILAKATRALAHAHSQRIAHRDIKPANILLDNQRIGGVYLCDFGLGRDLAVATTEQMRDGAGTPMYMAPERLLRVPADEVRCDIYSMGVTLFEALTLERPFQVPDHVTLPTLPAYLASTTPRRPREARSGFPEEYEAIILRAMAREAELRHESADQLAEELEQVAGRWASHLGHAPLDGPHSPRDQRSCLAAGRARDEDYDSSVDDPDLRATRPNPVLWPYDDADLGHFSDPPCD